ncbi:MAG TPA: CBS domain-containing protein, partial [Dehalococcoidia bacterium]|nr:CBS domain-containing protein [Dehalococcoidia bacterium]
HLISVVCGYLALVNFSLGVFNMLPGFPLDGGRVFRAMVWGRKHDLLQATRIASIVGVGVAYLMILAGVVVTFWAAFISGIWLIFIGWFLKNMSEASYQQMVLHQVLEGMPVSSLARDSTVAVLPQTTLRELADEYILRRGLRYFPVVSEAGVLLGLISLTDLQHVPDSQWPETTVYRAMTPRERLVALSPSDDAVRAFELMVDRDVHQLPVLESDDRLLGFVTRAQLLDLIRNRVQLGQPGGASLKT